MLDDTPNPTNLSSALLTIVCTIVGRRSHTRIVVSASSCFMIGILWRTSVLLVRRYNQCCTVPNGADLTNTVAILLWTCSRYGTSEGKPAVSNCCCCAGAAIGASPDWDRSTEMGSRLNCLSLILRKTHEATSAYSAGPTLDHQIIGIAPAS